MESAEALQHIRDRFSRRNIEITPNNLRQSRVPSGAEVVLNSEGSAPMFVMKLQRATMFFVPGVPREYRHLVEHHVLPRLGKRIANDEASYRYLAESIRVHPDQHALKATMMETGFDRVDYHNLAAGIVALHIGRVY